MPMAPIISKCTKKEVNRGTWTAEEDEKLAKVIEIHGPKRWKMIAAKAGLNRCGKSCRLRWMNYLRPNIKRGNISDQEEDLILRLHKLLGNRWSLIAGRLPGRTDNEIKNYWNSHLSKKIKQNEKKNEGSAALESIQNSKLNKQIDGIAEKPEEGCSNRDTESTPNFIGDALFSFCNEEPLDLGWMNQFLQMDDSLFSIL
ncbi:hypothetical protein SLEP1_g15947 [Rubroshorea leprosula]|uniref:Uncharacterized protein n=1 Tax=Rubroshorea leprosula TaxID=152421 RepID=A0AAV5IP76_9ROSI|nr:hypothetical protein SLEP1_g15947 [Rubroshorea leprosula]